MSTSKSVVDPAPLSKGEEDGTVQDDNDDTVVNGGDADFVIPQLMEFVESDDPATLVYDKEEEEDKENVAMVTSPSSALQPKAVGDQIIKMLTGITNDIQELKSSMSASQTKYMDMELRLWKIESQLENDKKEMTAIDATTTTATTLEEEPRAEEEDPSKKGWIPVAPDPQEPFCSSRGHFLWVGSHLEDAKQRPFTRGGRSTAHHHGASSSPTKMIVAGTSNDTNHKFAILVENQLEITKQFSVFLLQLKSLMSHNDDDDSDGPQHSFWQGMQLLGDVKDDIAEVKQCLKESKEQYNRMEEQLAALGASTTALLVPAASKETTDETNGGHDDTNKSQTVLGEPVAAAKNRTTNLETPVTLDAVDVGNSPVHERKVLEPDPQAPFCSCDGNFIWIAGEINFP